MGFGKRFGMVGVAGVTLGALRALPCLVPACGVLAGAFPVGLWGLSICGVGSSGLWLLVGVVVGLLALPWERWGGFGVWVAVGVLLAWLHCLGPWRTYGLRVGEAPVYVEAEAVVVDERVPRDEGLGWLPEVRSVRARLRRIRRVGQPGASWRRCGGVVMLWFREGSPGYGATVRVTGLLQEPRATRLPGVFDYRRYLRTQGIAHVLAVDSVEVLRSSASGWRRLPASLYAFREAVLAYVSDGIADEEGRAVLAAMTFGFRQGLAPETRDRYVRSGMVHLFAISGLHVGICFLLLMGVLSWCGAPFSWRHYAAPTLLLLYVVATGAAPSAMRAWIMLSIWSVGRGLRRPVVASNAVLAAGLFLVLWNPLVLFQAGFQFSFAIVFALVWGWQGGTRLCGWLWERERWVPARYRCRSVLRGLRVQVLRGVVSLGCAWLGGLGLAAYHTQLFLPASVLVNLLVGVLAWLILAGAVVKAATALLFGVGGGLATWVLGWCLWGVGLLAELGAEHGGAMVVARPWLVLVLLYYGLLWAVLAARWRLERRVWAVAALLACIVVIATGHRRGRMLPRVTVLMPAERVVPVVVVRPPGHPLEPLVCNAGPARFGASLGQWLRSRGVGVVDGLALLDNRADFAAGAPGLWRFCGVRSTTMMFRTRRGLADLRAAAPWHWHEVDGDRMWLQRSVSVRRSVGEDRLSYRIVVMPRCGAPRLEVAFTERRREGCRVRVREWRDGREVVLLEEWLAFAPEDRMLTVW